MSNSETPIIRGTITKNNRVIAVDVVPVAHAGLYRDTTAHWNMQPNLVSEAGAYYVYTDYIIREENGTTVNVPGLKIGDGTTYLIDLPFLSGDTEALAEHISDNSMHVTEEERLFWNNKVTAYVDPNDEENIVLTKLFV